MVGKNNVGLLTAVSIIIVLLAIVFALLLYGELGGRKTYEGTFAKSEVYPIEGERKQKSNNFVAPKVTNATRQRAA